MKLFTDAVCFLPWIMNNSRRKLIFLASSLGLVNLATSQVEYGWRISLAIGIPSAIILLIGGIWLPETPNSLMERDRKEEARQVLQKLRGIDNVDDELALIEDEAVLAKSQDLISEWKVLFSKNYKGEATVACMVAIFSQVSSLL